jgi:hypothetical protein
MVAAILPRVAVGNSLSIITIASGNAALGALLLSNLNSFVVDFALRQSLQGSNLNIFLVKQLPLLLPQFWVEESRPVFGSVSAFVLRRAFELTYTSNSIRRFAGDIGYDEKPFAWDDERRFWLRAELDAAFFHLYGIARDDVDYILETFPIVKRKDIAAHGSYRTKDAILAIYDEMAEAMRLGAPYSTRLNPPPANGWTPPPLPPLEDLITANPISAETPKAKWSVATPSSNGTTAVAPRVANLFEEAPKTLFDAAEDSELEPESVAEPPVALGPIVINGQSAQLVEMKALDPTRTQYKVILDSTGELKSFVSPPATVTGRD